MIKMITCSFYNTLIDKEDAIPLSTMLQIDKARQEKIKFTILTNRSSEELKYYNRDYPFIDYVVAFNGNYIVDFEKNKVLYKNPLTIKKIKEVLSKYQDNNIILYGEESTFTKDNYQDNKIYKIEVELKRKDIKDLTDENVTFKYNRKTYLEITNTNDYDNYKKLLKKLKISNDEVLQVIGNDSEQVLINDFSNTYLIGNSSKLLKSFKINKTSSNNLKGFEKVLIKNLNKR